MTDVAPLTYRVPPAPVTALIDAPELPDVSLSPDRRWLLLLERPALPPIAELAEPEAPPRRPAPQPAHERAQPDQPLPLAGPAAPAPGAAPPAKRPTSRPVRGLPDGARITGPRWSPDGAGDRLQRGGGDGLALWVADVATGAARPLTGPHLSAAYGTPYHWAPDSRSLVCKLIPPERGPAPEAPRVPAGPVVQETADEPAAAWTFQDLLRNPYDADCFEHYLTAEVARIGLDGAAQRLGGPALMASVRPSPDGAYLLVESSRRPFSYLVPAHRFPTRIEVWDAAGTPVYLVADLPLAEDIPPLRGAVRTGRRSVGWRADAPATLVWAEAQDGGDPRTSADVRDRVSLLPAPFGGAPTELAALALRFGGLHWGDDDLALVDEWWWQTRRRRTWRLAPARPADDLRLLFDRSFEDRYADPGSPLIAAHRAGHRRPAHLAGRQEPLPLRGGRLTGRRPPVPRPPRPRDRAERSSLALRRAVLRVRRRLRRRPPGAAADPARGRRGAAQLLPPPPRPT